MSAGESQTLCPNCGAPLPEVAPESLCPRCTFGALLGDQSTEVLGSAPEIEGITVHEEVGEGGFGIVYRATETGTVQRRVALKVLKPGVDTRQVLRRFQVERQALALLEHPNIARIYQAGETKEGYPYFTMEFIDGVPITEYLAHRELREILELFEIVCGAVAHAHRKGIIHRDLKPSNILVTLEGIPKVIDFGVAKAIDPDNTPGMTLFTGGDAWLGTPAYMAPEQADANDLDVDARADVYALGAILYEILTGMTPLEAATGKAAKETIGTAPVPLPSKMALRKIPKDLDAILLRALAGKPENRYESALDLAADLCRFQEGERIEHRARPRNRKWWWLGAAVLLLISLSCYFIMRPAELEDALQGDLVMIPVNSSGRPYQLKFNPSGEKGLAVFRGTEGTVLFNALTGEQIGKAPMHPSPVRCAAFSKDRNEFVVGYNSGAMRWYSCATSEPTTPFFRIASGKGPADFVHHTREGILLTASGDQKFRASTREGESLWEVPLVAAPYQLAIDADEEVAVVGSGQGDLNLISLREQNRVAVLKGHSGPTLRMAFSPSDQKFVSSSSGGEVRIWNRDGTLHKVLSHRQSCEDFMFSPDEAMVATVCHDGVTRLWDVESGEIVREFMHHDRVFAVAFSPDGKLLAAGGRDHSLQVWSLETGTHWQEPRPTEKAIDEIRFTVEGNLVALTWKNALRFYRLSDE